MHHDRGPAKAWTPLPEGHAFDQLNGVVDVTDPVSDREAAADEDRVVARNAANISGNISAGGLQ